MVNRNVVWIGVFLVCIVVLTIGVMAYTLHTKVNQSITLRGSCVGSNATAWISVYSGSSMIPDNMVLSLTPMIRLSSNDFILNISFNSSGLYTAYQTCIFGGVSQHKSFVINVSDSDVVIVDSSFGLFNYELLSPDYSVYFRSNSNLGEPVRFEKDGYFFVYDISQGTMTWVGLPNQPSAQDTLGAGMSSNSGDTVAIVGNSSVLYPNAFYHTNISYDLSGGRVKELFILSGITFKSYDYLQYSGSIYFNSSLKICTDVQCFIPKGVQDDFETSGRIYFKDMNNSVVFYLDAPMIYDSANHSTLGVYSVHGSNARMNFWLRINSTWLQNASFPVFIDPTIVLPSGLIVELLPNIVSENLIVSAGVPLVLNTSLLLGDSIPILDAECELDIVNNFDGVKVVDYRSFYNVGNGDYVYTWINPVVGNFTLVQYCWRGDTLDLYKVYSNTSIEVV